MITFACLPWNKGSHIIDFNVGVFFFLAISSISVVGILLASWSSNNKYSLIGAMRSGAQIISYELSIGMTMCHDLPYGYDVVQRNLSGPVC